MIDMRLKRQQYEMVEMAETFLEAKLLKSSFNALKLALVKRRIKEIHVDRARSYHNMSLMRLAWSAWSERHDQKSELRLLPQSARALCHHRRVLLTAVWDHWRAFVSMRQIDQVKESKADIHYLSTLMPKYFQYWKEYTDHQIWKTDAIEKANSFQRCKHEAKYFTLWQETYEKKMEIRTMERIAQLQFEKKLAVKVITYWRLRAQDVLDDYENMHLAGEHHRLFTLKKSLILWRKLVSDNKQEEVQETKAVKHYQLSLLKSSWSLWRQIVNEGREEKRLTKLADSHYSRQLLLPVLTCWHDMMIESRARHDEAEYMYEQNCQKLQRKYFMRWKEECRRLSTISKGMRKIEHNQNIKLLNMVCSAWKTFAHSKVTQRQQDNELIMKFREHHNKGFVRNCLSKWRQLRDDAVLIRLKESQAVIHYERKLLASTLQDWRDGVEEHKKVKILNQQAEIAQSYMLQKKYLNLWKGRLQHAKQMSHKNYLALLHWSLTLQRKCMEAWFYYTEKRKRKELLYEEAFEKYKKNLVLEGLRQWCRVADHMTCMRDKLAADRHTQELHRSNKAVLKCFHHWKSKTANASCLGAKHSPIPVQHKASQQQAACSSEIIDVRRESPVRMRTPPKTLESAISYAVKIPKPTSSPKKVEKRQRPPPVQPSYLLESLEREGLYKVYDETTPSQISITSIIRGTEKMSTKQSIKCPPMAVENGDLSFVICPNTPNKEDTESVTGNETPSPLLRPGDFIESKGKEVKSPQHKLVNHLSPPQQIAGIYPGHQHHRTDELLPPTAFMPLLCISEVSSSNTQWTAINLQENANKAEPLGVEVPDNDYVMEIESIRDELMKFKRERRKLKKLREQRTLLSECLSCLEEDAAESVQQELNIINQEISSLTNQLTRSKTKCTALSERLNELTTLLES